MFIKPNFVNKYRAIFVKICIDLYGQIGYGKTKHHKTISLIQSDGDT